MKTMKCGWKLRKTAARVKAALALEMEGRWFKTLNVPSTECVLLPGEELVYLMGTLKVPLSKALDPHCSPDSVYNM